MTLDLKSVTYLMAEGDWYDSEENSMAEFIAQDNPWLHRIMGIYLHGWPYRAYLPEPVRYWITSDRC